MNKNCLIPVLMAIILMTACNQNAQRDTKRNSKNEYAIVYNVLVNESTDNYDVFAMNIDGSNKKNINNLPGVEWAYFSDKERVLFISDKDTCQRCFRLYESNYKGENSKKISDIRLADSWMSSRKKGAELIVTPHAKVDSVFYVIDLKGNILSRLETGLPYSGDPLFVNDGKQVVFRGGLTMSKLIEGFNEELYIVDDNGQNRHQLTHYPVNE